MFGPKITTVFRSRWNALWWSLGILATAYCSVPPADEDDQADSAAALAGSAAEHSPEAHTNPWAKTAKD